MLPLSKQDIIDAIESTLIDAIPVRPNVVESINIEGVRAIYTPQSASAIGNTVGQAQLNENNVDNTIEQVIAFYKNLNHACSWIVSENSTPANLGQRLEHYSFQKIFDLAGMYLDDFDSAVRPNPVVTVRLATKADSEHLIRIYTEAYPMPDEEARMLLDNIAILKGRHYLACVEELDAPVSVANMFYLPDKPIVALEGAATLPDFRGRGIYTSLMAKRLQDARADGMQVAILQGDMETSAPICMKLGFQKVCDMAIYVWSEDQIGEIKN